MEKKIAVVTGASSGIGRCTAIALRDLGCKVYDLSRRDIPIEDVKHIKTDITIESDVMSAVKEIIDAEGKVDIL
ncbi:MAG: SDR family NAD(P)-dependent oxidoreductase, partial [Clostridia bacterium]|nr:SDR family NAD(P)-dependent oxidoreductase [Clostridia bacterium]